MIDWLNASIKNQLMVSMVMLALFFGWVTFTLKAKVDYQAAVIASYESVVYDSYDHLADEVEALLETSVHLRYELLWWITNHPAWHTRSDYPHPFPTPYSLQSPPEAQDEAMSKHLPTTHPKADTPVYTDYKSLQSDIRMLYYPNYLVRFQEYEWGSYGAEDVVDANRLL